jgi:hypothetical protein
VVARVLRKARVSWGVLTTTEDVVAAVVKIGEFVVLMRYECLR